MRIAVDATSLLDVRTGVGVYTASVLEELGRRSDLQVTAFPVTARRRSQLADVVPAGIETRTPLLPARLLHELWRRVGWPPVDRLVGEPEVVYGPNFVVPPARAARVVTVHDLTAVRFPELCQPHTRVYPELIRRAADGGAWVHAVTEAVRIDIIDLLGIDPDRIVTVWEGTPQRPTGDAERGRRLAGFDDYVLAVGTVEPRKDVVGLIHAVDRLQQAGVDVPLVHAGPPGWGAPAVETARSAAADPHRIRLLGRRSDQEIQDLYVGARLVAYPSVYEGFGLPVLEAMAAGVPVVTTRVPAIEEVAGDAACLVEVGDVDGLSHAIDTLWHDDELRASLRAAGLRRVGHFDWATCADGLVSLFHRALEDHGRP